MVGSPLIYLAFKRLPVESLARKIQPMQRFSWLIPVVLILPLIAALAFTMSASCGPNECHASGTSYLPER